MEELLLYQSAGEVGLTPINSATKIGQGTKLQDIPYHIGSFSTAWLRQARYVGTLRVRPSVRPYIGLDTCRVILWPAYSHPSKSPKIYVKYIPRKSVQMMKSYDGAQRIHMDHQLIVNFGRAVC